jgi:hypothetical protein
MDLHDRTKPTLGMNLSITFWTNLHVAETVREDFALNHRTK